ncbi:PNGase F N-terminal domain-containing protein [Flavobacterium sp.]|uniref:PNGase F N-terminal domain-containing protein n=1 Tax=Flavobacterium sp. TaxID=239 RepID=UPI00120DF480|nr:PNGase F N-terminal domain-containing protein [Flavobacterium sp.]RZJ73562.1 MAG: peptide-N-glycosidase [Flavobacterium sp.]
MKKYFVSLLILLSVAAFAQKKSQELKVTYLRSSNGKLLENQEPILVFASDATILVSNDRILSGKADIPNENMRIDVKAKQVFQMAQIGKNRFIGTKDSTSIASQKLELLPDTKKLLGYNCKKAKTVINSNTIEIWYTTEAGVFGAPSSLGISLGLVLETVRNGNFVVSATKIEKVKNKNLKNISTYKFVDALTYRDLVWKSRFTTIEVFKKEIVNFGGDQKSNDSILRFANGTIVVKKVKFPEIKSGSQVFVDVTEQSNGDAYDRTGSVFVIPTDAKLSFLDGLNNGKEKLPVYENGNGKHYQGVTKTDDYEPLLELMRFFTPFGVSQYNTLKLKNKVWQDSVMYRQDISDFIPRLSNKEVYIGLNIGNYDKGGHKASVNITIHKEEIAKPETVALPIFNTNNVMEMAGQEYGTMFSKPKGLEVKFKLDLKIKNAKLRYITTGHGGWENGDEFVPKQNSIYLDGKLAFAFTPWRTDCGSYRLSNPASGNFENGLSSSDYSRSNWCPGTTTNPVWIDLGDLDAGEHTIAIDIPLGASEGTSFSAWNVSGVLVGVKQ